MSREALGLVALDAGFLAAGTALLAGLGLVRSPGTAVRYGGLALVLGWAATAFAASLALVAGVELTVRTVILVWAALVGASVLLALRVPPRHDAVAREPSPFGRIAALNAFALLLAVLVALFVRVRSSGSFHPDVWGFWLPRAKTIFHSGELDLGLGGYASFTHAEYPPLAPTSDATAFLFMGRDDVLLLPVQHWVVFAGFVWALGGLLAGRVRPAFLSVFLAVIALTPNVEYLVGSLLADEPLVELFALAAVCGALWLLEGDWRHAALLCVLLATLALTKNEGLMLGLVLVVVLAAVTALRPWRALVALAAAPVLAAVPWRAWLAANDVRDDSDYRFGDLFDAGLLSDRADRLGIALREFPRYVLDPDRWLLAVPFALILAALLVRRRPALAGLCAGTIVIVFAAYVTVYWIGSPEIRFYLDSSGGRLSGHLAVFAAALAPLLAAEVVNHARGT